MNRPDRAVRLTAVGIGIAYGIALYVSGVRLDLDIKRALGYLPVLAVLALAAWDLFLWRAPLLSKLTSRPHLAGLWRVTLTPTGESHIPEGGNRGPITAYMRVKQSYWTVAVQLFTAESSSVSRSFFWDGGHGLGVQWLTFTYENVPQQRHQSRSSRHLGSCTLRPGSKTSKMIAGTYFTDRYTQGDMKLEWCNNNADAGSYQEAEVHATAGDVSLWARILQK